MKKTQRSKRLKCHASKRAVQALTAGAAIAAGTQAYANPISFENPVGSGHFEWFLADIPIGLDLTLDATSQTGATGGPSTLAQNFIPSSSKSVLTDVGGGIQFQAGGVMDLFAVGVGPGEIIPSGFIWQNAGYAYYPGYGSELPEGQATYLGVRFDLGEGNQYGWIGVVREGVQLDAFAWGYETEPGVPIVAPEPSSLAALAFGVAFAGLARRRS